MLFTKIRQLFKVTTKTWIIRVKNGKDDTNILILVFINFIKILKTFTIVIDGVLVLTIDAWNNLISVLIQIIL